MATSDHEIRMTVKVVVPRVVVVPDHADADNVAHALGAYCSQQWDTLTPDMRDALRLAASWLGPQ